jgi:hypothetical protein
MDNGRNCWLPGRKVLISPIVVVQADWEGKRLRWIATVDWKNSNVYVNLSRVAIKSRPEFNSDKLDREYETQLYKHYGQENYW